MGPMSIIGQNDALVLPPRWQPRGVVGGPALPQLSRADAQEGYVIIVTKPFNKHITSTSAAPTQSSLLQWRSSTCVASVLPSIFRRT